MAGLSPSIRLPGPPPGPSFEGQDVELAPEPDAGADRHVTDDKGAVLKIEHPDGSITIRMDGAPLWEQGKEASGWFDNLVDDIDAVELSRIADDLLRGIADDITSRQEWVDARSEGIKLLGLKTEIPGVGANGDGAAVAGISTVRHPLLLEAVLRFQANARSELLPTDGPVKIRDDGNGSSIEQNQLGDALETDLNHYLTVTATEYYPDTDRMLLMLGFGGTAFKKVYYCPLRNRPVSETVDAEDLIVNASATDLRNARRVTHRIMMRPSVVKRLQILGVYKNISLSQAKQPELDAAQLEKKAQQGVSDSVSNPDDRNRPIYECYCELDIKGFEHKKDGEPTGLEIPYRVTIDVSTREVLEVVRNYEEDDELPEARPWFVKYTFVPGFGFYDIGLLNILGNTTNAMTAAWRELLDMGMYANFPGFLFSDEGGRQNTNIFRVPPGGGAPIKTNGMAMRDAVMPLPYSMAGAPALMTLVDNMAQTGMRIGGTSEQQVGEGRADAPVGTTLAMIEQATKIMNAVHKRLHAAQAEEFQMLVRVFKDHPKSFWQRNRKPAYKWDERVFLQALDDCDLIPQADPNTASHGQRVMKIMALKQLQAASPALYDPIAIDKAALQAIGFNNPDQFMAPPDAQAKPPPELIEAQALVKKNEANAQATMITANARMLDAQTKAKAAGLAGAEGKGPDPAELQLKAADIALRREQMHINDRNEKAKLEAEARSDDGDLAVERMRLASEVIRNHSDVVHEQALKDKDVIAGQLPEPTVPHEKQEKTDDRT
jgi:hypothetical protein